MKWFIMLAMISVMLSVLVTQALAVPPGPPIPAVDGCPGRSIVDPGTGPQAVKPNLDKMANGECPVPTGLIPPGPPT